MTAGRKRVLFLIPSLRGGGAERFFCILLRHLDRGSFEPHLALFQAYGDYLQDLPAGVVVHDLRCSRGRYALPGIVQLVRKLRPQAVLSTLPQANIALILSRPFLPRGTRVLLSEAALASAALKDEADVTHPRVWAWLYRHFYKRADKVVCLSNSMIDDMALNFNVPRERLVRIYYPLDLQRVREFAEAGGNPYAGPGPHLVAAGRLCPQKGFDLLLAAMPAVRAQFPQARLTILGQGPLLDELTSQSRRFGLADAVCFLGFKQNPWPYFKYADVFVLSSRYEGLPHVLLETLALGTPIVATDCPGAIREIHESHPEIVMVPPENPKALAGAIIRELKAAAEKCKTADGLPPALDAFSLQQVVSEYSHLLMGEGDL
jgi:glycosyltransferase involved in cell wall biosynthesis